MGFSCCLNEMKLSAPPNAVNYGKMPLENFIPFILEIDHFNLWAPFLTKCRIEKQLGPARFLVEETYDLPFPLSRRKGRMYLQLYNNIGVDGTFQVVVRSYDQEKPYWLPDYVQQEGDKLRKEIPDDKSSVQLDVNLFIITVKLLDQERCQLIGISNFSPKVNFPIPLKFQHFFGQSFATGWFDSVKRMIGDPVDYKPKGFSLTGSLFGGASQSKSTLGYNGTPYEQVIKNIDKNPKKETYDVLSEDVRNFTKNHKSFKMAKL